MSTESIRSDLINLNNRIKGINSWIREHPDITDPNAYEIMDCNIAYAELISQLNVAHNLEYGPLKIPAPVLQTELNEAESKDGIEAYTVLPPTEPPVGIYLTTIYPEAAETMYELGQMAALRSLDTHPFFNMPEAKAMYDQIQASQIAANYDVPEDEGMRRIKRELLCKSMSVPFYIWQVKRTEPNYQYDNMIEFEGMKQMNALYQASCSPAQFASNVDALHTAIDSTYKYRTTPTTNVKQN